MVIVWNFMMRLQINKINKKEKKNQRNFVGEI